jgi:very-short-patch-repair endonuclease
VADAAEVIEQAERGRVTTLFCEPVALARSQLRAAAEELEAVPTLVELEWERAPSLARELDEIRDALADAARSLWPAWYVSAEQRFDTAANGAGGVDALVAKIAALYPGASASWLREAYRRCQQGRRPVVRHVASAEQVRQLALSLDPKRLVFALSVNVSEAPSARLRGLARAAEWLAHEAQAKTLLIVPESWRGRTELDHVTYGALTLDFDTPPVPAHPSERPLPAFPEYTAPGNDVAAAGGAARSDDAPPSGTSDAPHVSVGPIVGKPHPGSEVEQLVSARLAADAELRGLFECNQRLPAFGDKHYIVDLVWRTGKLIVELDGAEHNGQIAYARDRERDYRLLVSGYATLRVLNAEVCVDVDSVITKIRNVVHRLSPMKKEISR